MLYVSASTIFLFHVSDADNVDADYVHIFSWLSALVNARRHFPKAGENVAVVIFHIFRFRLCTV